MDIDWKEVLHLVCFFVLWFAIAIVYEFFKSIDEITGYKHASAPLPSHPALADPRTQIQQKINNNLGKRPSPGGASLEQQIMETVLNPLQIKIQRVRLVDEPHHNLLTEAREVLTTAPDGTPTELKELLINVRPFDDGTSPNQFGICRCRNCNRILKQENMKRCFGCGRLCCTNCVVERRGYIFHSFLCSILRY